jgi:hypothetical protein
MPVFKTFIVQPVSAVSPPFHARRGSRFTYMMGIREIVFNPLEEAG